MAKSKPTPRRYRLGWRVHFYHPKGVRHQVRFPDRRYPDAHQAACDFIDAVLGGRAADWEPMAKVIRLYLNWAERTGKKSAATIRTDHQRLGVFADWCKNRAINSPRDITLDHLRSFYSYFLDNFPLYKNNRRRYTSRLSADELNRRRLATWDKYRLALSAWMNWCVDREYMAKNFLFRAHEFRAGRIQQKVQFRVFTPEELELLFNWTTVNRGLDVLTYFRLLASAGLRTGEAERLQWGDIDLTEGVVRVQESKGKNVRAVPLDPDKPIFRCLAELHGAAKRRMGLVFADERGNPARTHDAWYKLFQTALKHTGLEHARLHDLRHTFGAHLAMAGVPISEIQELMGHERYDTTRIYVHFAPKHLAAAVKKLPY